MSPTIETTAPDTASVTLAIQNSLITDLRRRHSAIAFIDAAVDDYPMLVDGVLPGIKVVVLSSDRDGITQITETLQAIPVSTTVYIVAHGAPGCLKLGNSELSLETCDRYTAQLQQWFQSNDSQLLLYACNLAAGEAGAEFLATAGRLSVERLKTSAVGDWDRYLEKLLL